MRYPISGGTPVNLLWTGGWDSTFRLLQATVCNVLTVQPYYVIDHERQSLRCEFVAMAAIKDAIGRQFPAARERILPTLLYELCDIPQSEAIVASRRAMLQKGFIGGQYEWLARLAQWQHIPRLELAVHQDDRAHAFIKGLVERDSSGAFALSGDSLHPAAALFRDFVFPILDITKLDMASIAEEYGFADIMERTWFCHYPDARSRPCGSCRPCRYTIQEGLARRIPAANRVKARAFRIYAGVGRRLRKMLPGRRSVTRCKAG